MRLPTFCLSLVAMVAVVAGCTSPSSAPNRFLSHGGYDLSARGPIEQEITQLYLDKSERRLTLISGDVPVREYRIDLGFSPKGHKLQQGDGRTPEGLYRINRKNHQSAFHLSLGISYPNAEDRRQAASRGVSPGGDIFIHGEAGQASKSGTDWTAGCISLPDALMDEIFAAVDIGTPILIAP